MFERRAMIMGGLVVSLLPSCAGQKCVQDKACANQLTFALNLEGIPTGSYRLELTALDPKREDIICGLEVDANGNVDVPMTLDCIWTNFVVNESKQAKLTLQMIPQTFTVKFLHADQELFAETGLSPDYEFGDGCDVCQYAIVDINPTFVE